MKFVVGSNISSSISITFSIIIFPGGREEYKEEMQLHLVSLSLLSFLQSGFVRSRESSQVKGKFHAWS
jgi:hypothetical protein